VGINRDDAASFRDFVSRGKDLLSHGASLAILPQGTRSKSGKLATFKRGAFTIATKAKAKVVPITILGSGDVMPSGREGRLHPGHIKVIVHPPINAAGMKTTELADRCRDVIATALPAWKLQWKFKE
jgi:1-acyl-sn-glycerol-3-phosphate acyltransferase